MALTSSADTLSADSQPADNVSLPRKRHLDSPERAVIGANMGTGFGENEACMRPGRDEGAGGHAAALSGDKIDQLDQQRGRVAGAQPGAFGERLAVGGHVD